MFPPVFPVASLPSKRRIVQISVCSVYDAPTEVYALDDYGTLWLGWDDYQGKGKDPLFVFKWKQLPNLPEMES